MATVWQIDIKKRSGDKVTKGKWVKRYKKNRNIKHKIRQAWLT